LLPTFIASRLWLIARFKMQSRGQKLFWVLINLRFFVEFFFFFEAISLRLRNVKNNRCGGNDGRAPIFNIIFLLNSTFYRRVVRCVDATAISNAVASTAYIQEMEASIEWWEPLILLFPLWSHDRGGYYYCPGSGVASLAKHTPFPPPCKSLPSTMSSLFSCIFQISPVLRPNNPTEPIFSWKRSQIWLIPYTKFKLSPGRNQILLAQN
jgi:hypothetical protein